MFMTAAAGTMVTSQQQCSVAAPLVYPAPAERTLSASALDPTLFDSLASTAHAGDFFSAFFPSSSSSSLSTTAAAVLAPPVAAAAAAVVAEEEAMPSFDLSGVAFADVPDFGDAMMDEDGEDDHDPSFDISAASTPSATTTSTGRMRVSKVSSGGVEKRKRRPKVPVPEDVKKTAAYQERRRKNNLAAARNREMKRQEARAEVDKLPALDARKLELQEECALLKSELATLKARLFHRLSLL